MIEVDNWSFLGVSRMPFNQQDCIPKLSYSIPAYSAVMEGLQSDIKSPLPKVVVLSGARGVGKSSLVESLVSSISTDSCVRLIQGSRGTGVSNLLKCIMDLTGVECVLDGTDTDGQIKRFCETIQLAQSHFILVIDNAQVLPIQTLAAISQLIKSFSGTTYAKIILVGSPILLDRVSQFNEENECADRFSLLSLKPFTFVETYHYISSKLYEAGWQGSPKQLSQKVIERIFYQSHGVARRINHIAEYELSSLISESNEGLVKTTIKSFSLPNKQLTVIFSGVLLAASSLYAANFFHKKQINTTAPSLQTKVEGDAFNVEHSLVKLKPRTISSSQETHPNNINQRSPSEWAVAESVQADLDVTATEPTKLSTAPSAVQEKMIQPLTVKARLSPTQAITSPSEADTLATVSADKGALSYYSLQQKVESDTQSMKTSMGFSLQLGAVETIEKLKMLLQRMRVGQEANLKIYQGIRGENPVYVVLLSNYTSFSLATKALSALPKNIQKHKPWIRTSSSISNDIRLFESMLIV
jgi:septal ring-binding cell division protein DamX/type II secretory pathway predicted ATPase ExeA